MAASNDPALRRKIHGMLHRDVDGVSVTQHYANQQPSITTRRRRADDSDSPPLPIRRRVSIDRGLIHGHGEEEKEWDQDITIRRRPYSTPSSPLDHSSSTSSLPPPHESRKLRAPVRPWKTMTQNRSSESAMAIIERKYEQMSGNAPDSDFKDATISGTEESDSESQPDNGTSRFSAVDRLQRSFRKKGKKMSLFSNRLRELVQNKFKRPTTSGNNGNGNNTKKDDDVVSSADEDNSSEKNRITMQSNETNGTDPALPRDNWRHKAAAVAPITIPSPSASNRSPSPTLTPDAPPSLPARPTSRIPFLHIQELMRDRNRPTDTPSPKANPTKITIDAPEETIPTTTTEQPTTSTSTSTSTLSPTATTSPKPNIVPTFNRSRTEFARNSRSAPAGIPETPFGSPRASVMIENKLSSDVTALRTTMQQQFTTLEQQLQEVESAQSQSTSDMPVLRTRIETLEDALRHQKTNFESRLSRLEHQIEVLQTVQKKNFRSIYDHLNALQSSPGSLTRRSNASDQGFFFDFLSLLLTWFTIGLATVADPITSLYRWIRSFLCPSPQPRTKSAATSYSRKLRSPADGMGLGLQRQYENGTRRTR